MANIYISGAVAIAEEVLSNRRMQWGILTFIISVLLPLNKAHKCHLRFWSKT